jgi:hypothetical protein
MFSAALPLPKTQQKHETATKPDSAEELKFGE